MRNERKSCSEPWLEKKKNMRSLYSSVLEVLITGYYLVTELKEIFLIALLISGDGSSTVVKVQCYKSEGRCFDRSRVRDVERESCIVLKE